VADNALAVLGPGGRMTIAVRQTGADGKPPQAEVAIADDGPGISPEVRRHLFDPFYSGRGAGRGLGMGLAKCWRIVTNHGGRIDVESTLGQGATFTVHLPISSRLPQNEPP
ncbi:MAG TPA: HAMP domain-containing sensor histidine kinase, partial [Pirellulales bacterium]|nr:HAMP domain-containing sensor histidine kinase [Pirellulales bacterium]